ncbi:nitroreductase family protein [Pseudomonadales bacterium]|nr:nitroreductase family protein [Pseudomonadales bacterium]
MTFVPLVFKRRNPEDARAFASAHAVTMAARRSVRTFSTDPVPESVIMDCVRAACTAPSGANCQPWHFVVVSDPAKKRDIRLAAEAEERAFYDRRASQVWLDALAPLGTDAEKPFLEVAPYLIAIFQERFAQDETGEKTKKLLCARIGGNCHRYPHWRAASGGPCVFDAHAEPNGFFTKCLRPPRKRTPISVIGGGLSSRGCGSSRHKPKAVQSSCHADLISWAWR